MKVLFFDVRITKAKRKVKVTVAPPTSVSGVNKVREFCVGCRTEF
jgi:hypothetical protein